MNKKALSRKGHIVLSIVLLLFGIFLYEQYVSQVSLRLIFKYLPFYLIGSLLVDKIETPSPFHRQFLHSKRFFIITLLVIIPFTLSMGFIKSEMWFHLTALFIGHIGHLIGDMTTKSGLS
tara:strand:+ start:4014 stop:4373 length:360 start_codon:yes stop_codon:yes gene_type:complete